MDVNVKIRGKVQDPQVRVTNFEEVEQGYTDEEALSEAARCLTCPKPRCVEGCPVGIAIPEFIKCKYRADSLSGRADRKHRTHRNSDRRPSSFRSNAERRKCGPDVVFRFKHCRILSLMKNTSEV